MDRSKRSDSYIEALTLNPRPLQLLAEAISEMLNLQVIALAPQLA
jgi:hypothetical protein